MKCSLILILSLLIYVVPSMPMISSTANILVHPSGKGGITGEGKPGGATTVNASGKGEAVTIHRHHMQILIYNDARESEFLDDLNVAVLLEDLKPGHKINMDFTLQRSDQASFLPRELADSIPFSSAKLDDILKRFGIKPGSEDAEIVKQTLMDCEAASMKGEEKYCATSWESMVDFGISKLGEKVEAVSTEAAAVKERGMKEYTIGAAGAEKVGEENLIVCHSLGYPYAVFYCHKLEKTTAYMAPLEGANGISVKAVVICHADTSQWHPHHVLLQALKVEPGTIPVCHVLRPHDSLVWLPSAFKSSKTSLSLSLYTMYII